MEPPKRPFTVVRNGNPTNPPKQGIDYKTIGIIAMYTTAITTVVGLVIYAIKERVGRKKNPAPQEALMPSPFVSGLPIAPPAGGHFIYVPPGGVPPRDMNPTLPNALRYTPPPQQYVVQQPDPNAMPSWFLQHAQQQDAVAQQQNARLANIENFLRAPAGSPDA